jgi:hypothetical protein
LMGIPNGGGFSLDAKGFFIGIVFMAEDHVWFKDRWMVASLCDE